MSLYYNDGTPKKVNELFYNNGSVNEINELYYNDNGVIKELFKKIVLVDPVQTELLLVTRLIAGSGERINQKYSDIKNVSEEELKLIPVGSLFYTVDGDLLGVIEQVEPSVIFYCRDIVTYKFLRSVVVKY